MPTIKRETSLGANASANPLAGSQYEFLPFDAAIQFAAFVAPNGAVEATLFSGTDVLLEGSPLDEKALTEPIKINEDELVRDVAAAGERIGYTIRETAGAVGPTVVRTVLVITPL
ncbi:MAG: hypothetical protein GWO02_08455 [Gammaproteobacteria bacterium]|nr:hypothetical protein [Gammaproteobacteria bacterium]